MVKFNNLRLSLTSRTKQAFYSTNPDLGPGHDTQRNPRQYIQSKIYS